MSLAAILEAREQRRRIKYELARHFRACVLSLCLNIPGPDKSPPDAERALTLLQEALRKAHARDLHLHSKRARRLRLSKALFPPFATARRAAILHEARGTGADGPYQLMVSPLPGFTLKRMAVRLEREHPLGRLADIDILTQTGETVSRADLGLPPRACFLCGEAAALCRRKKQHPQEMLMDFVMALLEKVREL